jgi:uncharacterized protein (DUF697 family)
MWTSRFWDDLRQAVFAPKVSESELAEKLAEVKHSLPVPVFWLLGKTQAGKTSLVRALTGRGDAEIGNGFRACTRTASLYDFPGQDSCFMRFLDTRGLGESAYDPGEDMRLFEQQAHVLIVVLKAMDHAQQPVLAALERIRRAHPEWPVIVAQTCLHEGYPSPDTPHPLPYPYGEWPPPPCVPHDLAASLAKQRSYFASHANTCFVPVDLTQPAEGFIPPDYGLEALWEALEQVFPWGLRGLLQGFTGDMYSAAAQPHILAYSLLAGGLEAIPVPGAALPLVLATQGKMFQTLASLYNQALTPQRFSEIAAALGTGYLLRLGGRQLLKFVPGYGGAVSAAYSAATTYALGKMLCVYFERVQQGNAPSDEAVARLFEEEFGKARESLRAYFSRALPGR